MAEQEQTSSPFEGGSKPQVENPDTSFSRDVSSIETLQESLPKYEGINPYAFKQKLVEDDEFFDQVTSEYAIATKTPRHRQMEQQDPEQYQAYVNRFKTNFKKDLVNTSYAGEPEKDTLINRTMSFRNEPQNIPTAKYFETITKNKSKYPELFDENGDPLFNEADTVSFGKKVTTNPELHNKIMQDRYRDFQDVLANSNNNPALLDDKGKLTQAWVVYDNFGKEGVTQYMNLLQQDNDDVPLDEKIIATQDAQRYFQGATINGKSIYDLTEEFITGGENPLTFRPVQPRDDLTKQVPDDFNAFTSFTYEADGDELKDRDPYEVSKEWLKTFSPEHYKKFQDVRNLRKDGKFSDEYLQLLEGVYEQAINNDSFSMNDLMNTLKVNGQHRTVEDRPVWRLNYDDMPAKARVALDALRGFDNEGSFVIQPLGNGEYDFRPKRREASQSFLDSIKNALYDTKEELYIDENGETQVRTVAEKGFLSGAWNTAMTSVLGGMDMINRFGVQPLMEIAANTTGSENLQVLYEKMKTSTGVDLASGLSADTDGIVPNAIGEVAPFIEYMGSMFIGGGGALKLAQGGYKLLTGAKKASDVARMAGSIKGTSRWNLMAERLFKGVKDKEPWTLAPKLYAGGAVVEATQPEETSFLNIGPELLGYEPTNEVSMFYKKASRPMQRVLDIGASLMFDGLADGLITGTKFLGAKAGQKWMGKKEFKGLKYDPEKYGKEQYGGYEVVDEPMFRTEVQEFWTNLTSELDKLPIGNVGETMARGVSKGATFKSLHDFARGYVDDSEWMMKNFRQDIEDNVKALNEQFGDGNLAGKELDDIVDQQYTHFLDQVAEQTYGVLRTSSEELPLKFAQTLDEQVPTIKEVKQGGMSVPVGRIDELRKNNKGTKYVAKNDKIFEINPNYWTIELAERLRSTALEKTSEDVYQRKINALGDIENKAKKMQEIEEEVDRVIGTPVEVDGKRGFIVDFDDTSYTIRSSDGDVVKKPKEVTTELSEEQIQRMTIDATNSKMVRQRLMLGRGFKQSTSDRIPMQRRLPEANINQAEQTLVGQIDQIDGRIGTLRNRYQNLDTILDDSQQVGVQRRQITREIKQLQEQKIQTQKELSRFYMENPQVQGARKIMAEEINVRNQATKNQKYVQRVKDTADKVGKTINKQLQLRFC